MVGAPAGAHHWWGGGAADATAWFWVLRGVALTVNKGYSRLLQSFHMILGQLLLRPKLITRTGKPRGSGWDSGRTKLPNPRAPPTPSDADRGGGWERVRRDCRAEGSLEAAAQSKR